MAGIKFEFILSAITFAVILTIGLWREGSFFLYRAIPLLVIAGFSLPEFRKKRRLVTAAATCCFFVILVNIITQAPPQFNNPDARGFWELSRGTATDIGNILYRPKGYPWFLNLFNTPSAAVWAQIILRLWLTVLLGILGWQQKWRPGLVIVICVLFGLNVLWLQEQGNILDTTLFSVLWFGCFFAFLHLFRQFSIKWLLIYALSAGWCTLTRQLADPFLLLGFLILFIKHRRQYLYFIPAGLLFISIGWAGLFVNWGKYGIAKRTIALGVNLYTHSAYYELADKKSAEWNKVGPILEKYPLAAEHWNPHYSHDQDWYGVAVSHRYQRYLESTGMSRLESDNYLKAEFFSWIQNNPVKYQKSVINELFRLFFKCEEYPIESVLRPLTGYSPFIDRLERSATYLPLWLLLLLPVPLIFNWRRWNIPFIGAYTLTWCYLLIISMVAIGITRYTLPVLPFLYFCMGETFNRIVPASHLSQETCSPNQGSV